MRDVTPRPSKFLDPEKIVFDEDMQKELCAFVANGGSPTRWALLKGLNFGEIINFKAENLSFQNRYNDALKAREEWFKESILDLLNQMLAFDTRKAYDDSGKLKDMGQMPTEVAAMIKKVKTSFVTSDDEIVQVDQVEFYDKQKAIDQLGKHIQMFVEKTEHHHKLTLEETIARAREKSKNK